MHDTNKILSLFGAIGISLAGCVSQDGSVYAPDPTKVLANAFTLAGAYYNGRAQGYQCASPIPYQQHGMATVFGNGQTTFIDY